MTAPMDPNEARAQAAAAKAYGKAQRPWVARHKILTGLGALIALGIVAGVAGGSGGGTNSPAAADQTNTVGGTGGAPQAAAGTVLLNVSGNGTKQSQKFTAGGDWDLAYSYDCAKFGTQGNFLVEVNGSDGAMSLSNTGVNELGDKGADVTHEHHGGTYYLSVDSECSWTIKVTSA